MPPPQTGNDVLELVRKSDISDESTLNAFLQNSGPLPPHPGEAAAQLHLAGILTAWQGGQILQGKYKRFRIRKYLVLDKLGSGTDPLYRALDTKFRRQVLIRTTKYVEDTGERFSTAVTWWQVGPVEHPNLVRDFGADEDMELAFVVMESLDGKQLPVLLEQSGGRLPVGEACGCAMQVATGLQALHERERVHERITPSNVFVCDEGVVKILNHWDSTRSDFYFNHFTLPRREELDAAFAAPEQSAKSSTLDTRCDCYSLGALFSHMIGDGRNHTTKELASVIAKMKAKKPEARYQSMTEVIAALRPFVVPAPPGICPPMAATALEQSS